MNSEHVSPMRVTDITGELGKAGEVYELDFNRESALFAFEHGVKCTDDTSVEAFMKYIPDLFYYAFRKNYTRIPREKIDKIRKAAGGLTFEHAQRLIELYLQGLSADVVQDEESFGKNGAMAIEL